MSEFWAKLKIRHKLVKAFKSGELYLGTVERPIFPKIRKVTIQSHSTIVYFSIPHGLDPKELKKKDFCFKQAFGQKVEIEGESKEFKLIIRGSIPKHVFKYDYEKYREHLKEMALPILVGIDMDGNIVAYDMAKQPHLLIAGETGSGKSTQFRSILVSLIQTLPPERLRFYMADLKLGEFHLYRKLDHLDGPICTNADELHPVVLKLQKELKRRGKLLDTYEVSDILELPDPPPFIIFCIDEVALLKKETAIMNIIEEYSSIGRALGMFLILTMQRPDAKILDGKLKVNLTCRMGMKTADLINARIIGTPGSEKITQKGRLLLKLPTYKDLKEVQSPNLEPEEAKKILVGHKDLKINDVTKTPPMRFTEQFETTEIQANTFGVLDGYEKA